MHCGYLELFKPATLSNVQTWEPTFSAEYFWHLCNIYVYVYSDFLKVTSGVHAELAGS